jgi:EPS-associated MarR family transcriptional regulator
MFSEELRYRLMRLIEEKPGMSQRDAARELGISLGRVNFCVQALIRQGWVKAVRFKNSRNKLAYMYLLTQRGMEEKVALTLEFLRIKTLEYETLCAEIERIEQDVKRRA